MLSRLLLALLLICLTSQLPAQKLYQFRQLTEGGGLRNSRCVSLLQDEDDFMWFATHSGVDRFNGSSMQHYSLKAPNSTLDNDNIINIAIKSKKYSILCASKSGSLYYYNREKDRFDVMLDNSQTDLLFNIYSLFEDAYGNIWIGNSSGLFYFDVATHELIKIESIDVEIFDLDQISQESLILATEKGLYKYNISEMTTSLIAFKDQKVTTIFLENKNNFLIGTNNSTVASIIVLDDKFEVRKVKKMGSEDLNHPVKQITMTPEGQIAVGVDGKGIYVLDNALGEISHYVFDKDDQWSLSSNGVYDIYYSTDNILWVATWGGGVCFADPNQKPFEIIRHVPYLNESLWNNAVSSIAQVGDEVWYGTKEGISIHNEKSNTWKHLPNKGEACGSEFIALSMTVDSKQNVWVATYGKGLLKYSPNAKLLEVYDKDSRGIFNTESNYLYAVLQDRNGAIWSAGIWGRLTVFDFSNNKKEIINLTNVRSIYEYGDEIFVGTLFGVFIVNKKTYAVTRTSHQVLNTTRVIVVNKHPLNNNYYFGTDAKGLVIWDRDNDEVVTLTEADGLASNFVRSVLWSNDNELWVTTTGGLSKVNTETLDIESYRQEDGLAHNEFSENAVIMNTNGKAHFGGPNGVTIFTPERITKSDKPSSPILNGLKVLGYDIEIESEGILTKNINLQDGIILPYQQNSFTIKFGAIAYTNPHKVQYQWRLVGLNDRWMGPSYVSEANYTEISSGKYTFELMSSNEDGVWHPERIKTFEIHILKPFWLTIWAMAFYVIILGAIVYLLLKYYNTMLHDKHSMEKQQFFISIAHDLRTPLSLIKIPVEKMVEKSETLDENRKSLVKVKRNVDRLTNLVNQLLDFQKVDLNKMQLRPEKMNLVLFLEERVQAFEPFSQEKDIMLLTEWDETAHEVYLDKDKMEKIMYNLLSNAFKYTPKGGEVLVTLKYTKKNCIISVQDTGEGIPQNQQSNIFKRYYRATNAINSTEVGSGVGLMLTKQLVEMHNGTIRFVSELGKGSTFTVTLPMKSKELTYENIDLEPEGDERISSLVTENKATEAPSVSKGERLLVVEDNPELRQTLVDEFSTDYQVLEAADGVEGVRLAKQYLPRIIISDVMMPHKSGHELCSELKEALETCHIPIILLTALDSPEYKREGLEYGADAYMEKPFEVRLLRTQILNLLKSREVLKKKYLLPSASVVIEDSPVISPNEELLEKVKSFALNNLLNPKLSVETTAIEVGLSRPVLYRKIKSLTDLSPQQFLLTIRLNEAARVLKLGVKNVSEAAYDTGFSDPKYFSQIFKKHFGKTPSQYVKEE